MTTTGENMECEEFLESEPDIEYDDDQ